MWWVNGHLGASGVTDFLTFVESRPRILHGSGGLYAGLFFPFRAARYDGKLSIGDLVSDLTFDVNRVVAGAAPAGDLPAAEPIDTSAALTFVSASSLPLVAGAAIAFWSILALVFLGRQRRAAPARAI